MQARDLSTRSNSALPLRLRGADHPGVHELRDLTDRQSGVVARRQLLQVGWGDHDIRREVRNRRLTTVHRGVYVNHTGPLSWSSRAWAAVLFHEGSALCGPSALTLSGDPLHVAIPAGRQGVRLPGVVLHQLSGLDDRVLWNRSPPRLRVEEAALDVAGAARSTAEAVAVVSDVCGRRATTPERLLVALSRRRRTPRGVELRRVLTDAASGVGSVLERDYLLRVERPHGLPRSRRQAAARTASGAVYRDALYDEVAVAVELDGFAWHGDAAARSRDMSRDLESAADGVLTLRLGWRHVWDEPCLTAGRVARVLRERGWRGRPRRCRQGCVLSRGFQSPGD